MRDDDVKNRPLSRERSERRVVRTLALACTLGLAAAALARQDGGDAPAADDGATPTLEDEYAIIVRNNIFVRDRKPYKPPATQPAATRPAEQVAPPPEPRPEKDWRLVGIVFEDGAFRAYFESLKDEPTARVAPGDAIADGVIEGVYIDAVSFVADGRQVWVDVGRDLAGEVPDAPAAPDAPAEGESEQGDKAEGAETAAPADPSKMSVEERMRLRRQQQGG